MQVYWTQKHLLNKRTAYYKRAGYEIREHTMKCPCGKRPGFGAYKNGVMEYELIVCKECYHEHQTDKRHGKEVLSRGARADKQPSPF